MRCPPSAISFADESLHRLRRGLRPRAGWKPALPARFATSCAGGLALLLAAIRVYGLISSRLLASLLYGVTSTDPATFVLAAATLGAAAIAACWIPARRAMRVDPVVVLREE